MKTPTIILVIIIIAIAVFLIYSLTRVSGFELRDEHRALIGMDAVVGNCATDTSNGTCKAPGAKNPILSLNEQGLISKFIRKYTGPYTGHCFECQAAGAVDSTDSNGVIPNKIRESLMLEITGKKLTFSTPCTMRKQPDGSVVGNYNCADVVNIDGANNHYEWGAISDCFSYGNGICKVDGGALCNTGTHLTEESSCYTCDGADKKPPTYVPVGSTTPPKQCQLTVSSATCDFLGGKVIVPGITDPGPSWSSKTYSDGSTVENTLNARKACGWIASTGEACNSTDCVEPKSTGSKQTGYILGCNNNGSTPGELSGGSTVTNKCYQGYPGGPYSGDVYASAECCQFESSNDCEDLPDGVNVAFLIEDPVNSKAAQCIADVDSYWCYENSTCHKHGDGSKDCTGTGNCVSQNKKGCFCDDVTDASCYVASARPDTYNFTGQWNEFFPTLYCENSPYSSQLGKLANPACIEAKTCPPK